jgi:intracellular multiplication protein IcmE
VKKVKLKIPKKMQSGRGRIALLATVIIVVIVFIYAIYRLVGGPSSGGAAQLAAIPSGASIPAGKESQQYIATLLQHNEAKAQNALQTWRTSIPTLIPNKTGIQTSSLQTQSAKATNTSTPVCLPCEERDASLNSLVNQFESTGTMSSATANTLRRLGSQGLSPNDYAQRLKKLSASGQLTPAQAQALLAAYKQKYLTDAQSMDGTIAALHTKGVINARTAAQLKKLTAEGLTPAQYASALNRLVTAGGLSSAGAKQLMSAYEAHSVKTHAQQSLGAMVDRLQTNGDISAQTARALKRLNAENLSAAQYGSALADLVKTGKLSSQAANQLLSAHNQAQQGGFASAQTPDATVSSLQSSGAISAQTAQVLKKLNAENLSAAQYGSALSDLVKTGKLSSQAANQLLSAHNQAQQGGFASAQTPDATVSSLQSSGAISAQTAQALKKLNAENLSAAQYGSALSDLVKTGKLSSQAANQLLSAHNQAPSGGFSSSEIPDAAVSSLQSSGAISAQTAKALKKLNAQTLTPAQYAAQLAGLVKSGALPAAAATHLLNAYERQQAATAFGGYPSSSATQSSVKTSPASTLRETVAHLKDNGAINADTATALQKLANRATSAGSYERGLGQLVDAGQLTPSQARQLLAAYKANKLHQASSSSSPTLSPDAAIEQLRALGRISAATAERLRALNSQALSPQAYHQQLQALVNSGALSAEQAARLAKTYAAHQLANVDSASNAGLIDQMQANGALGDQGASQLKTLSRQRVSPAQYGEALKDLVASGQLSPAGAATLLQHYAQSRAEGSNKTGTAKLEAQQNLQAVATQVKAFDQQAAEQQSMADKAAQAQQAALQKAINSQLRSLVGGWKPVAQSFHEGDIATNKASTTVKASVQKTTGKETDTDTVGTVNIKAGDVQFAVLDTSVNSDRPGPIMATIVSGKFKGAKLLGGLKVTSDNVRVVLTFTGMSMPSWTKAKAISAVAINPDTAQTAMASNVDHHYLVRYGALFASSFLQGYSQAVQQSGSTSVSSSLGFSSQVHKTLSPAEKMMVALGQVGTNAGQSASQEFNRKPTVTVSAGVGLGILFLKGATVPKPVVSKNVPTAIGRSQG